MAALLTLTDSRQLVQYSYRTEIIFLYPPFMVAYAAAYIAALEAGYDGDAIFANVNVKMEILSKIVRELREAFEDEKRLYVVQARALEKLEDIVPEMTPA
jgi:hypothetical protein